MAVRSTRTGPATLASGELECSRQDILSGCVHHEILFDSTPSPLPLSLRPSPLPLLFNLLTIFLSLSLSLPLSPSHPLSLPLTSCNPSPSPPSHPLSLSLSLPLTPSPSHSLSLSLPLPPSPSLSSSHPLTLSPSPSLSVPRKLLLCRVTLGKPVEHITAIKIAHAPPGHHSVIGRPSAGGLNYPEYVIYRGEQVNPAQEFVLAITYRRSGNFRIRNVCMFNFCCVAKQR